MKNQSLQFLQRMQRKLKSSKEQGTISLKDMDEDIRRHPQPLRSTPSNMMSPRMVYLPLLLLLSASCAEACSNRLRNRNRPPAYLPVPTTLRPTITFEVFECEPLLKQVFCLNNATCFAIRVGDTKEYNCNCTEGFMGRRCEHKYVDVDGELLSQLSIQETLSEYAGLAGASTYVLLVAVAMGLLYYLRRRGQHVVELQDVDQVDSVEYEKPRPFGPRPVDFSLEKLMKEAPPQSRNNGNRKELL